MILTPTDGPEDWKRLLAKPDLHWKAGRSAMETALSWEAAKGPPQEIATMLPARAKLIFAIPEYQVPLPGGDRASQTDVMALFRLDDGILPVMVEAKRDEPFGPTLGEWLTDASDGKRARLDAICAALGLDRLGIGPSVRYQLLHRSASAVLTAETFHARRAAMLVQSFSPEHSWFDDFVAFAALFGLSPERGELCEVVAGGGVRLGLGWAHSQPRSA